MPTTKVSSRQVSEACGISRPQLDQWISRGLFVPRDQPENGKARQYDFDEAIDLCTMAELTRMGLPRDQARDVVAHRRILRDLDTIARKKLSPDSPLIGGNNTAIGDVILVVWQGLNIVSTQSGSREYYDQDYTMFNDKTILSEQLGSFVNDRNIRALVAVNLTAVKERLIAVLNKDEPA
jgi:DNA-binding transcriptional MerR regulator